jgi:ABC-type glycerol-3-phosphate transport system substrate-binding protein
MSTKLFRIPLFLTAAAMILAACAAPATPAPTAASIQPATQAPVPTKTPVPTATAIATATAAPTATTAPTATLESRGNITIMGRGQLVDAGLLDDFKNKYPGIQLKELGEVQDVYNLTPSELTAACVVEVQTQQMPELIKSGMLADITGKVAPYTDQLYPSMLHINQKDGKIYALPGFFGPLVFYYRRDIMKEAGLSDRPEDVEAAAATWDSFFEMCKTIKDKTGRSCLGNDAYSLYQMVLWQQGLGYTDQDGKLTVDSPQNIATLEELGKFWKSGYIVQGPDEKVFSKNPPISGFLGGSGVSGWMKRSDTSGLWGVVRMPAMAAGQTRASIEPWGISLAIPEACDQKEAAWTFIQFMYGREDSTLRVMDIFLWTPGLKIDENNPQVTAPDPFFGGQPVNSVYLDVAKNVPDATIYGPGYTLMVDALRPAVQKYVNGKISAADALKEAADQIRKQIGS